MADTFQALWREIKMYAPECPPLLCQKLVNDAYLKLLAYTDWSGLRAQSQFIIPDPYTTGTITATLASATFTGTGTAWTTDMIGRQLKVNDQTPILTITDVNVGAQTLTTDFAWGLDTATNTTYSIVLCYVTCPEDFDRFIAVTDPLRQWQLWWNYSQKELNALDPARTSTGDPWVLADLKRDADGIPMYELWPAPTVNRVYPFYYYKKGIAMVDADEYPVAPLKGPEIVQLALADLCRWPGSTNAPNPLFGKMDIAATFTADAMRHTMDLERKDQDTYLTWYQSALGSTPYAPAMASWTQSHAMYQ